MCHIGLVGCGGRGRSLLRFVKNSPHAKAEISGLYDVNPESAASVKDSLEIDAEIFYDLASMLTKAELDAVIVATPNGLHREPVVAAAEAGKHIFVEKPMALVVADCQAMIDAAKLSGVKLMVGHMSQHVATSRWTIRQIAAGKIGQPIAVRVTHGRRGWGRWERPWKPTRRLSGGSIFEVHIHELHLMHSIFGPGATVYTRSSHRAGLKQDFPDTYHITLTFQDGGLGQICGSMADSVGVQQYEVTGTDGSIHVSQLPNFEIEYRFGDNEVATLDKSSLKKSEPFYGKIVWDFLEAVVNDTEVPIPASEGLALIEMAEGVIESGESGDVVTLGDAPR